MKQDRSCHPNMQIKARKGARNSQDQDELVQSRKRELSSSKKSYRKEKRSNVTVAESKVKKKLIHLYLLSGNNEEHFFLAFFLLIIPILYSVMISRLFVAMFYCLKLEWANFYRRATIFIRSDVTCMV